MKVVCICRMDGVHIPDQYSSGVRTIGRCFIRIGPHEIKVSQSCEA